MFTKGEWKYQHIVDRDIINCSRVIANVKDSGFGEKETEANANLIASAPDLYEALLAFDEYVSTNYPANIRLKQIAVDRMERALAKAEGK